jgi:hypothetical protein
VILLLLNSLTETYANATEVSALRRSLNSGQSPSDQQMQALLTLLLKNAGSDPTMRAVAQQLQTVLAGSSGRGPAAGGNTALSGALAGSVQRCSVVVNTSYPVVMERPKGSMTHDGNNSPSLYLIVSAAGGPIDVTLSTSPSCWWAPVGISPLPTNGQSQWIRTTPSPSSGDQWGSGTLRIDVAPLGVGERPFSGGYRDEEVDLDMAEYPNERNGVHFNVGEFHIRVRQCDSSLTTYDCYRKGLSF